jgi:hypothetical protein
MFSFMSVCVYTKFFLIMNNFVKKMKKFGFFSMKLRINEFNYRKKFKILEIY